MEGVMANIRSKPSKTAVESPPRFWSEEPSKRPGRRRIRAHIGGLHCSLCTGTIEKALGRRPGVDKVAVSLTHEQALIEFDPSVTRADDLLQTLRTLATPSLTRGRCVRLRKKSARWWANASVF
jgi:copper chaperone CopZ